MHACHSSAHDTPLVCFGQFQASSGMLGVGGDATNVLITNVHSNVSCNHMLYITGSLINLKIKSKLTGLPTCHYLVK